MVNYLIGRESMSKLSDPPEELLVLSLFRLLDVLLSASSSSSEEDGDPIDELSDDASSGAPNESPPLTIPASPGSARSKTEDICCAAEQREKR